MAVRQRRWLSGLVAALAAVVAVGVGLWFVPTSYVVVAPGITGNLRQMVQVEGGHAPGPGQLLMVAVTLAQANELVYLAAHVDPALELLPSQEATGGLNMQQYARYNLDLMQQSKLAAEVAGERLAGLDARVETAPGALVEGVLSGPARGLIKAGDRIVALGPYPIRSYDQVRTILLHHFQVGEVVPVTVVRNHQRLVIPIRTMKLFDDPAPAIGVLIAPDVRFVIPRRVTIRSNDIGGPSAGMMFALEIYEQITGKNLARGRIVAGTGEVTPNGAVEAIGGVAQKVITVHQAGASVFLCPVANYAKAKATAARFGYHMQIYAVGNLSQAVRDLERG
ncbi:MAG: signal protein PDZ [Firmicutes bacterium]|nr:signal protein PDZ [Alicyclobacillaceae bacterium]MCL6496386.1 signal protein PDZ [Bacillota bacterium]